MVTKIITFKEIKYRNVSQKRRTRMTVYKVPASVDFLVLKSPILSVRKQESRGYVKSNFAVGKPRSIRKTADMRTAKTAVGKGLLYLRFMKAA
jgi:hypothetical protein